MEAVRMARHLSLTETGKKAHNTTAKIAINLQIQFHHGIKLSGIKKGKKLSKNITEFSKSLSK